MHLGDAGSKTDGKIYDPALKLYEAKGDRSGTLDDRWAFTSKSSALNYNSIAGLAAEARALKEFDDGLASTALGLAKIGRAEVWTPVTIAHLVIRLMLQNKK